MPFVRPELIAILTLPALVAGCSCRQEYTWEAREAIDLHEAPIDHGSWLSMDTAPDGQRLTVSYYDRENGGLGFAVGTPTADGVEWLHEHVDGYAGSDGLDPGDRGKFTSHKVADDGTVWVAYNDVTTGGLMVAHRTGKVWEAEKVDAGGGFAPNAGNWNSLQLDAGQMPVIAHYDAGTGTLRVTRVKAPAPTLAEFQWDSTQVATGDDFTGVDADGNEFTRPASVGMFARLLIDGGTEHLAFYDAAQQDLMYMKGNGKTWGKPVVVDDLDDVGQWPSIYVKGKDVLIAYHDVTNQDLLLATQKGNDWDIEVVDDGEFRGADAEIFEKDGKLSIVYFDGQENDMILATREGKRWKTKTIGGKDGAVGFHNEVVNVNGTFYAASYNFTNRKVFVSTL